MAFSQIQIDNWNQQLKEATPEEIVSFAVQQAKSPLVTTNFRPYEVNILHAVTQVSAGIKVIWCDTGYNTPQTYKHAEDLIKSLALNVK